MMEDFIKEWKEQAPENQVTEIDKAVTRLLISTWVYDDLITPDQGENAIGLDVDYSDDGFYDGLKNDFELVSEDDEGEKMTFIFEEKFTDGVKDSPTLADFDTILANIQGKTSEGVTATIDLLFEIDGDKSLNEVKDDWGQSVDAS